MSELIYETCRTDFRNDTSTNHAPILRIKKGRGVDIKFNLMSRDNTHLAIRELAINVSGSTAKIYDLKTETANAGISILFVESTNYFTLYVRGNYVGNAVALQLEKVSLANQVEFIHYGKYTKSVVLFTADGEKEIKPAKPARNNGERVYLSKKDFQNGWDYLEGFYTVKNGICYVNFSVQNGTMTNGTVILSGLPPAQWHESDPKHMYTGLAKSYTDDTYYGCILRLSGEGKVTIESVKGNKSLVASFSYPIYDEKY